MQKMLKWMMVLLKFEIVIKKRGLNPRIPTV
jgi:hypothetical protein